MYEIKTGQFQGPLDLLLQLIEKNKLDITQISLAQVADDYLQYVQVNKVNLRNLSEFLLIASQLILLKSKALLPFFVLDEEEEEDTQLLEERLKEYQKFKKVSQELKELLEKNQICFSRQKLEVFKQAEFNQKIDPKEIHEAFLKVLSEIPKEEKLEEKMIAQLVSLEEKMEHLTVSINKRTQVAFSHAIAKAKDKGEVVVTFLAVLEMLKQQLVVVEQKDLFSDFTISNKSLH